MSLEEHIQDIRRRISSGEFHNEQSVSQGIVLRLLGALDWSVYDTQAVIPEYSVQGKRVDFALCARKNKPAIFIEVKQIGNTPGADQQLFQYAYHQGIPFVIVTDGREWHFYLPAEMGSYDERRVYKLDLVEQEPRESASRLNRYLSFAEVEKGDGLEHAREDYRNVSKARRATETIPAAWEKLLGEKDDALIEVVAEKAYGLCGHKPPREQVINYLHCLKPEVTGYPSPPTEPPTYTRVRETTVGGIKPPSKDLIRALFPDGTVVCEKTPTQTMIAVIKKIGFRKVAKLNIVAHGHTLVSQQQHIAGNYKWNDAGSGYFVCTKFNTKAKARKLREVSDQLGLGVQVEEVPASEISPSPPRTRNVPTQSKTKTATRMKIKITFPNGKVICHSKVMQTLIDAVNEIGPGKVATLNINKAGYPMVSRTQHAVDNYQWNDIGAGYYLYTRTSTDDKMRTIDKINRGLNLGLRVTLV